MKYSYIKNDFVNSINVMRSEFISYIFPAEKEQEISVYLNQVKKEHPKARHYIYAYILNETAKCNDDGEPSGTAGKPTLSLLQSKNLNNVLLITVRYFGGTLLGSSRLLRTYVESANLVINKAELYTKEKLISQEYSVSFEEVNLFKLICASRGINIDKMVYNIDTVNFLIISDKLVKDEFENVKSLNINFIKEEIIYVKEGSKNE